MDKLICQCKNLLITKEYIKEEMYKTCSKVNGTVKILYNEHALLNVHLLLMGMAVLSIIIMVIVVIIAVTDKDGKDT